MPNIIIKYDDLDFTETVEEISGAAPQRLTLSATPKSHGSKVTDVPTVAERRITIRGRIQEQTSTNLRDTIDDMERVLHRNNKKLRIWDDRYIYAYCAGFGYSYVEGTAMASADYVIEFICPNPFWQSDTASSDTKTIAGGDLVDITNSIYRKSYTITNAGSAFVYPIITITAPGSSVSTVTVRNLTTNRYFTYTGTILATKVLVINCLDFTVVNNGTEDLSNWSGSFLWLDPGDNSMQIETVVNGVTFKFDWTARYF